MINQCFFQDLKSASCEISGENNAVIFSSFSLEITRTIVTVFNEKFVFNSCQIHLIHLNVIVFMNSIQFNHNCQIMGDFLPLIKIFVDFLQ